MMTYTIKPLEFTESKHSPGYYTALGCGLVYCINPRTIDQLVELSYESNCRTSYDIPTTKDTAIAAANEHHRQQIEKFLLPVECE